MLKSQQQGWRYCYTPPPADNNYILLYRATICRLIIDKTQIYSRKKLKSIIIVVCNRYYTNAPFPNSMINICVNGIVGLPSNVTSVGEPLLQPRDSWQDIVKDNSPGGWSYDGEQSVLWIRLTKGGLVNIHLK